jgi:hypothetical protein
MRPRPGPVGEPSLGWPVPRVARTPSRLMSEMIGLRRNDSERAREHPRRANARLAATGWSCSAARSGNSPRSTPAPRTTAVSKLSTGPSSTSAGGRHSRAQPLPPWHCCAARWAAARADGRAQADVIKLVLQMLCGAVVLRPRRQRLVVLRACDKGRCDRRSDITPNATPWSITATTPRARPPRSWASRRHSRPSLRSAAPTLPDARVLVVIKRPDGHAADDHDQQRRGRDHACRVADRHRLTQERR